MTVEYLEILKRAGDSNRSLAILVVISIPRSILSTSQGLLPFDESGAQ